MKIHLRQRKLRKKGWKGLYLEYYKGSTVDNNGKRRVHRDTEQLNLYIHDKPRTREERDHNR